MKMSTLPGYIKLRQLNMDRPVYGIGLMSGTSVDAVDAAIVEIDTRQLQPLRVIDFIEHPIPNDLRNRILDAMKPEKSHVDIICQLNFEIAELFAEAVNQLIQSSPIPKEKISFIGSHGQTVYHIPVVDPARGWQTPSTLQLGSISVIAERTGITTVGDFRTRDMAAGGTGAPLIPFFDAFMFANEHDDVLCQNIGGIANCTLIQKNGTISAFDSGPGNMVMDALMRRFVENQRYDKNGDTARSGKVNQNVLQSLLQHPYFKQPPPKATGHEDFGAVFVDQFLKMQDWKPEDALATACEFTAQTIVDSYRDFVFPKAQPKQAIISGGGTKNAFLKERLQFLCPEIEWVIIDQYGIPSDAKEAAGFALLAFATVKKIPSNIPSVTGAQKEVILGTIAYG
jgi:anhydro-N-acetylmuramic acid kinase